MARWVFFRAFGGLLAIALAPGIASAAKAWPAIDTEQNSDALIRPECAAAFQKGIEYYFEKIEKKSTVALDIRLKEISEDCRPEFSMGIFEGQLTMAKLVVFEFLLDEELSAKKLIRSTYEKQFLEFYKRRWKEAELGEQFFFDLLRDRRGLRIKLEELKKNLWVLAKQKKRAISFGRFVFTPGGRLFSNYEYKFNLNATMVVLPSGELDVKKGSYQVAIQDLQDELQKNYEEYMNWKPSAWFGQDSLVYGAARLGPDDETVRQVKERGYFENHEYLRKRGEFLGLDPAPFQKIEDSMFRKQRAYLDYDIHVVEKVTLLYKVAPAFPLALQLGAVGIGYTFGVSATTAANISAGIAVVTFAGLNTVAAIRNSGNDRNSATEELDFWVPIIASSLPISMAAPAVLGAGAASVKYMVVEGIAFWATLKNVSQWMRTATAAEKLTWVKNLPMASARAWFRYWFKVNAEGARTLDYSKIGYFVAYNAASIVAEVFDREYLRSDPREKFFLEGGKINPLSLYKLIPGAVFGLLYTPVMHMENLWTRYLAYRALDLLSNASIAMVVRKNVDYDYLAFDFVYSGTVSTLFGESARIVNLNIMNSGLKNHTQFALNFAFSIATIFPRTTIRNYLLSLYRNGVDPTTAHHVKIILEKETRIRLENFSDEEVASALKLFLAEPEVFNFLKNN